MKRKYSINLGEIKPKRNSEGLLICLNCDNKLPKRRRKYCSDDCAYGWATKHNHQLMRSKLIKKFNGKCKMCGQIPTIKINRISHLADKLWNSIFNENSPYGQVFKLNNEYALVLDDTKLILDHIKPIAIGGGEFDENNLQIICWSCNKIKTRQDRRLIANNRKIDKVLLYGQLRLNV